MTPHGTVRFEKWEGLGNDFALFAEGAIDPRPELVRSLCDRRFGVGADGVILVGRSGERPRMTVYNADGSRPEMCGNGLRCVAAYLAAHGAGGDLVIVTDAGDRACKTRTAGPDTFEVTVDMGVARRAADLAVVVDGREHRFATIDVGNPHAITFEPYDDAAVDRIGPQVAVAPPGGTNVEFCRLDEEAGRIVVTVWERGVGRTLACGTGACAVAAAACEGGRAAFGAPVRVALPGGELEITVTPGTRALRMRGPARRVFLGEVVPA